MIGALNKIVLLCFFMATMAIAVYSGHSRDSIMIVHSYNTDYAWTNEVNIGINRVLKKHPNLDVVTYYLDTKNMFEAHDTSEKKTADNTSDEQAAGAKVKKVVNCHDDAFAGRKKSLACQKETAGLNIRKLIDSAKPSVLVLIDDDAQKYVGKYYLDNDFGMAIVFAGINHDFAQYYCHAEGKIDCSAPISTHVAGIMEKKSVAAIQEVIQGIHQSRFGSEATNDISVTFLTDKSTSVENDHYNLSSPENAWRWKNITYRRRAVTTLQEWQQAVEELSRTQDYILVGGYRKLKKTGADAHATVKEVMCATIEHTRVPVIGLNFFNSEDGAHLSIGVSPYQQGEEALKTAIGIIGDKEPLPGVFPSTSDPQYIISINQHSTEQLALKLPGIYRAFAESNGHNYKSNPCTDSATL